MKLCTVIYNTSIEDTFHFSVHFYKVAYLVTLYLEISIR